MNEGAVAHLVGALWGSREAYRGRIDASAVTTWGRMLAEAVQAEVREKDGYSPETDRRVLWAREVLASAVRGDVRSRASVELEVSVEWLLGIQDREPCGKELSAGCARES